MQINENQQPSYEFYKDCFEDEITVCQSAAISLVMALIHAKK